MPWVIARRRHEHGVVEDYFGGMAARNGASVVVPSTGAT